MHCISDGTFFGFSNGGYRGASLKSIKDQVEPSENRRCSDRFTSGFHVFKLRIAVRLTSLRCLGVYGNPATITPLLYIPEVEADIGL